MTKEKEYVPRFTFECYWCGLKNGISKKKCERCNKPNEDLADRFTEKTFDRRPLI